jgi:hypothetical protein
MKFNRDEGIHMDNITIPGREELENQDRPGLKPWQC